MTVNLSFTTVGEEDFITRGAQDAHSVVSTILVKKLPEEFASLLSSVNSHKRQPFDESNDVARVDSTNLTATAPISVKANFLNQNEEKPSFRSQTKESSLTKPNNLTVLVWQQKLLEEHEFLSSVLNRKIHSERIHSDSDINAKVRNCKNGLKLNHSFSCETENRSPEHFIPSSLPKPRQGSGPPVKQAEQNLPSLRKSRRRSSQLAKQLLSAGSDQKPGLLQSGCVSPIPRLHDQLALTSPTKSINRSVKNLEEQPEQEISDFFLQGMSEKIIQYCNEAKFRSSPAGNVNRPKSLLSETTPLRQHCLFTQQSGCYNHRLHLSAFSINIMNNNDSNEEHSHDEETKLEPEEVVTESDGHKHIRMKSFDEVVFDVLKVSPEEFARQLTLLDFPIFCAIRPEELTNTGWTKKEKWRLSPNVCAITQRFNHTSFWVIREILNASTMKIRAEVITHFIKIAKKLHELNNLHSLMAVIQSLNSSSIFRLTKTWSMIHKHHKTTFDKLLTLVKQDNNRTELRAHMKEIKLPCIPFVGMYLSDIMYINTAHPDTGGLETQERSDKMNNVLRVIAEFQQSKYDHLKEEPHIKKYLNSVKYIEELQKFLEEDNYKLSLKIEPSQTDTSSQSSPTKKIGGHSSDRNSTPKYFAGKSLRTPRGRPVSQTPPVQHRYVPCHRKSRSLGRELDFAQVVQLRSKSEASKLNKRRSWISRSKQRDSTVWYIPPSCGYISTDSLDTSDSIPRATVPTPVAVTTSLLDDSIIATSSSSVISSPSSATQASINSGKNGSLRSSKSDSGCDVCEHDDGGRLADGALEAASDDMTPCKLEGVLKKKSVLKHGKKPKMPLWKKYWVQICGSKLFYFEAKATRAHERHHFKSLPCKVTSIHGWLLLHSSDHSKDFQLSNAKGDVYRFQCESKQAVPEWNSVLREATKACSKPEPDLINLEDP